MKKIRIGNKWIGGGEPCFIIAEAGINHNGDVNLAKKLIDVAEEAGADAVKFQTFNAEAVVTRGAEKATYQKAATGADESQLEMVKKLELTEKDFTELYGYAQERGIIFLSSPFDQASVDILDNLGVPAFKIPSGEITNFPLLRYIAGKKKPLIFSTGMSTLGEVEEALGVLRKEGAREIVLLHCVSSYPAKAVDMNLKVMETLRYAFRLPVGLSDHTLGIAVPIAAVALGACIIEKHFTLDRSLPGPDHKASLEPGELQEMVGAIRDVEAAMGDGVKRLTKDEQETRKVARRRLVARADIPGGATITEEMLDIKRSKLGIEAKHMPIVIGRKAGKSITRDSAITWDKI